MRCSKGIRKQAHGKNRTQQISICKSWVDRSCDSTITISRLEIVANNIKMDKIQQIIKALK